VGRRLALCAASLLTALTASVAVAPNASAAALTVTWNFTKAGLPHVFTPNTAPPGANNWSCRSAVHPVPVVLVNGTTEGQSLNWSAMAPYLTNKGYCVYTFNYGVKLGVNGLGDIAASAGELKTFIETVVLPRTGAAKVDLVGHSQGGMMPRHYIKFLGGFTKVRRLVGISPSNHGTSLSSIATAGAIFGINPLVARGFPGLTDQTPTSAFMKHLNTCPFGLPAADICTGDPVKYTVIQTTEDRIVTPYTNAFLQGATNILMQQVCPLDDTGHIAGPYDRNVGYQVIKALDPATAGRPVCVKTSALNGG
jgi:pimeloyl-ACP methyl ester carboxylesterase